MNSLRIAQGSTGHQRHGAITNSFRYPVFFLKFPVAAEAELKAELRRRFPLLSFRAEDYLWRRAGSLAENIRDFLRERCGYEATNVSLMTMPRIFGYAFNPISFWFCKSGGRLEAVLCEVNNTFGERHFYWVQVPESGTWIHAEKHFHVSPFFPVSGSYRFRFYEQSDRIRVDINYLSAEGQPQLSTWVDVDDQPLELQSPWKLFFKYGWISLLVVWRIHFQAFRLWFKKVQFYRKPEPPQKDVSL